MQVNCEEIPILDHGYLRVIEVWGSDQRIIESARMSTNKGFQGWGPRKVTCDNCNGTGQSPSANGGRCSQCGGTGEVTESGDERLLRYLYKHKHATPFEFAGMQIEVQAPVAVFREWHRHRTQSYNEMSARYTPMPDLNYLPTVGRLLVNSKTNKQAGTIAGADTLTDSKALAWQAALRKQYAQCQEIYQLGLDAGVPKELARMVVPVGRYSRMRAQAVLRNWLAFLTLRCDPAAQWEIRQYANVLAVELGKFFPRTMELFNEGQS